MATTSKRKESKKEEAKAEFKSDLELTPSSKEYLSPDHLRQLEVQSRDVDNAKLLMALEEQSLRNMNLELQLLVQKIEKQKQVLQQRAIFYDNSVKQFEKLKAEIWPLYGFDVKEGLGYDPETGRLHKQ